MKLSLVAICALFASAMAVLTSASAVQSGFTSTASACNWKATDGTQCTLTHSATDLDL